MSFVSLSTSARRRGPRQGVGVRVCVTTRQRTARSLLLRVVRRPPPAKPAVTLQPGANGRSAYVSRSVDAVREARRRRKLSRALRADVPMSIYDALEEAALACESAGESLGAAEAFARATPLMPVDALSEPHLAHDSEWVATGA